MMTNEERREVAAKLQNINKWHCYNSRDVLRAIEEACGCNTGESWQDMVELRDRLVDIIEPEPESTCKMKLIKRGPIYTVWRFSCCGYEHGENNTDSGATGIPETVCPKFGAKVER